LKAQSTAEAYARRTIPYWAKIVALFFVSWLFIYGNRAILTPVIGEVKADFGMTNAQIGLMNSLFFLAYTVVQIPSGILGDTFSKKWVLIPGFFLSGVCLAITGAAESLWIAIGAWTLSGIGQGTYYGPQFALSSQALPGKYRTLGSAIINSGGAFGLSLGFMVSSYFTLSQGYSWRISFYLFAALTIMVSLIMWVIIKEEPNMRKEKTKNIETSDSFAATPSMKTLFTNRNLLVSYAVSFCSLYGFSVMVTWLPYYLQTEREFDGSEAGVVSSLLAWASLPGALAFSWLCDRLGKRKLLMAILIPCAALSTLILAYSHNPVWIIIALICYGLTGKLALDPVLIAFVADNAPKELYGTAFGVYNFVAMSSTIFAPYLTGYLADRLGSMEIGFYLSAGLLMIGVFALFFAREKAERRMVK
jgi:sugar phosphate permease